MSKKGFKAPFTAPVRSGKDKLSSSPKITSQNDTSLGLPQKSASPPKVSRRNESTKKLPAVSLTDAEYEELFNSVIKSAMSMSNSQHSSQNYSNNDKDERDAPKSEKAKSKFVANTSVSHTIKNNGHICKQHNGKTETIEKKCSHQTQRSKQSGNAKANALEKSPPYIGVKPKRLFKEGPKKQEEKLIHETHHCVSKQTTKPSFQKGGRVVNASSKHTTASHSSGSYDDNNKQNTPSRNQETHHCRSQSGKGHICSRANTPTRHHTSCSGHLQSPYNGENREAIHTPCKSHATVRTPNTPTTLHSHSCGSYDNDKNDDIPTSHHKSTCSRTPCSGHSTGREKGSQKCHAFRSLSQSQPMLSQPPPELSLKERLEWLQKRRDVGLWVQCSYAHCSKWRYLHDIHDPVEVPEKWYCHMNTDKNFNSCSAPEKGPTAYEEEDLIHNLYTAGSIVWGRLDGYPWWPAMVDDDPDTEQYYWLNGFSDIPTHYNVTFFDDKEVTRAWLTPNALKPFTGMEAARQFRKTRVHGVDYSSRIEAAKSMASEALQLGIGDRLRKFSFLSRFKGPFGTLNSKKRGKEYYDSDSSDDQHSSKRKRLNVTKRKKQTSVTHSSRKLHNRERETKSVSKKTDKKKDTGKSCSHKAQTLISKHVLNSHSEKPIVQETESLNNDESISKTAEAMSNVQEESVTQCSVTNKTMDDDYEINSSQDLFLSQEKNNTMSEEWTNDNEEVTSTTEVTSDLNDTLKNTSQRNKSQEIPQNTSICEKKSEYNSTLNNISQKNKSQEIHNTSQKNKSQEIHNSSQRNKSQEIYNTSQKNKSQEIHNTSQKNKAQEIYNTSQKIHSSSQKNKSQEIHNSFKKNKSQEVHQNANEESEPISCNSNSHNIKGNLHDAEAIYRIAEEATENEVATTTTECNMGSVMDELSDAIVPSSQKKTTRPGDAVVPNSEESYGQIRNDDLVSNHNSHCSDTEDSMDFEPEE